jgi:hypothetical protein
MAGATLRDKANKESIMGGVPNKEFWPIGSHLRTGNPLPDSPIRVYDISASLAVQYDDVYLRAYFVEA